MGLIEHTNGRAVLTTVGGTSGILVVAIPSDGGSVWSPTILQHIEELQRYCPNDKISRRVIIMTDGAMQNLTELGLSSGDGPWAVRVVPWTSPAHDEAVDTALAKMLELVPE